MGRFPKARGLIPFHPLCIQPDPLVFPARGNGQGRAKRLTGNKDVGGSDIPQRGQQHEFSVGADARGLSVVLHDLVAT